MSLIKCKECGNEINNKMKECPKCGYPLNKIKRRKTMLIIGIVLIVILLGIFTVPNMIKDIKEMQEITDKIEIDYEFDNAYLRASYLSDAKKEKGYNKILTVIDEKIKNIKQGKEDKKLKEMFDKISLNNVKDKTFKEEIKKRQKIINSYSLYTNAIENIKNENYKEAYNEMWNIIEINSAEDDLKNIIVEKMKDIKERAESQLIEDLKDKVNQQDYATVKKNIEQGFAKNSENEEIKEIYNNAKKEVEKQEQVEKERREAEKRKEEEERKNAEINKYKSAIKITNLRASQPNSAGGVDLYINWRNLSDEVVKYIYFTVVPYNAVNDIVTCDIRRNSEFNAQDTGPYYKGQGTPSSVCWKNAWYNYTIKRVELKSIEIKYMDGTSLTIPKQYIQYIQ